MTEPSQAQAPVRRSNLRFVLHLWAGICLKAAADVSGIFAVRGGQSVESASATATGAGLVAVLLIVVGYYLSHQLVSALDKSSLAPKIRKGILIGLPFAYFVGAILLGGTVGLIAGTAR
jgi:hypothetical protein